MNTIAPEIFKAYDIRGIVGKSLTPDTARRSASRSAAKRAPPGSHDRHRSRRPPLRPDARRRTRRRHHQHRHRRRRHRLRADAGDLLRRLSISAPTAASRSPAATTRPTTTASRWCWRRDALRRDASRRLRRASSKATSPRQRQVLRRTNVRKAYLDRIVSDVKLARPMKIVVDCGNGVAGELAPELFRRMGCEVHRTVLRDRRHTSPITIPIRRSRKTCATCSACCARPTRNWASPSTATATGSASSPRMARSSIPDRQLMLFAADVLTRNPGAQIIYDVKCSRWVAESDAPPGRPAADVEHRPRPDQGQAQGNRRAAGRRDERPHVLQGALVRLRRRPLCRRAPARNHLALARFQLAAASICRMPSRRPNSISRCRKANRTS